MENTKLSHPEWEKENSLTAPEDRASTPAAPWRPDLSKRELTEEEASAALADLSVDAFVKRFPRMDRTYADPPPVNQQIGLVSFTPAKGLKDKL